MTWGSTFKSAFAAASEQSRLAARKAIEQVASATVARNVAGAPSNSNGDGARAYHQAAHAIAKADALLAPLALTDWEALHAADAAAAQPPSVIPPHEHHHPTGQATS